MIFGQFIKIQLFTIESGNRGKQRNLNNGFLEKETLGERNLLQSNFLRVAFKFFGTLEDQTGQFFVFTNVHSKWLFA